MKKRFFSWMLEEDEREEAAHPSRHDALHASALQHLQHPASASEMRINQLSVAAQERAESIFIIFTKSALAPRHFEGQTQMAVGPNFPSRLLTLRKTGRHRRETGGQEVKHMFV